MYDFPLERTEVHLKNKGKRARCKYYTEMERDACVKKWLLKEYLNMSCPRGAHVFKTKS